MNNTASENLGLGKDAILEEGPVLCIESEHPVRQDSLSIWEVDFKARISVFIPFSEVCKLSFQSLSFILSVSVCVSTATTPKNSPRSQSPEQSGMSSLSPTKLARNLSTIMSSSSMTILIHSISARENIRAVRAALLATGLDKARHAHRW